MKLNFLTRDYLMKKILILSLFISILTISNISASQYDECIGSPVFVNQEDEGKFVDYQKKKGFLWDNCIGIFEYFDGDKFEGLFINGVKEGYGTYYYPNGNKYEGNWFNDKIQGYGTFYFQSGSKHEGEYLDGKRNGYGTYYYTNGDMYEGEYLNDKYHGYGIYTFANGTKYEGEYLNDEAHGYGIETYASGAKYEGDFLGGKRTGKGKYIYSNGDIYIGEFLNGKRHGQGEYFYDVLNSGAMIWSYIGDWKEDKRDGFGILSYHIYEKNDDGINITAYREDSNWHYKIKYIGDFKDDILNSGKKFTPFPNTPSASNHFFSFGDIIDFTNEESFLGYNADGFEEHMSEYEGEFRDFKFHGQGKLSYHIRNCSNNNCKWIDSQREGIFKDGEFLFENVSVSTEDEEFCIDVGFKKNTPEFDKCVEASAKK